MSEPSKWEANKVLRVLEGTPKKYTVRVHRGKEIIEFQSEEEPKLDWVNDARCLYLVSGYSSTPICKWEDDMILLVDKNPKD